jgi:hypothetical protein
MTTDTQRDLIDALESFEDAERAGIVLSREAVAQLCVRLTEAFYAAK